MMALSTGVTRRMASEACDRAGDCQRLGNGARGARQRGWLGNADCKWIFTLCLLKER